MHISMPGIGNGVRQLLFTLGDSTDTTPPEPGTVSGIAISGGGGDIGGSGRRLQEDAQVAAAEMKVHFDDFLDTETEIEMVRIMLGRRSGSADFLDEQLTGNPGVWSGEVPRPPRSGQRAHLCVEATNSQGLSTTRCARPLVWDAEPPRTLLWVR